MIKRKFGWTNIDVPIIGQGTWLIEKESSSDSYNLAIRTLQMGLDLGMTHIDTAEMYENGKAEELAGQTHNVAPDVLATAVREFVGTRPARAGQS